MLISPAQPWLLRQVLHLAAQSSQALISVCVCGLRGWGSGLLFIVKEKSWIIAHPHRLPRADRTLPFFPSLAFWALETWWNGPRVKANTLVCL